MDAVQRLGIPGRTPGMGGCGAECKNKDFVNFRVGVSSIYFSFLNVFGKKFILLFSKGALN